MKKALIIVDFQNDFISGTLGFPQARALISLIQNKAKHALETGEDLIFTLDTHEENYPSTQEGTLLPVVHCLRGTEGWKVEKSLEPYLSEAKAVIEKPSFGTTELISLLRSENYDEVELCGLVSNICVISNAVIAKAALPEARVIVDAKATSCLDDATNQKALDIMQGLQIDVVGRS